LSVVAMMRRKFERQFKVRDEWNVNPAAAAAAMAASSH